MQDKIITAIAAYLEKNCNGYGEFIHFKDYPECWDVHVATEIAAAIAPQPAAQIKFKYAIGQNVWVENGSVFTKCTVKYIHIQQGAEPGKVLVRYEMNVFSGWFRESEVYETKETAMADNR